MKPYDYILISIFALSVISCAGSADKEKKADEEKTQTVFQAQPFPEVQIPAIFNNQREVLVYLSENYWQGITDSSRNYPSDSLYVSGVPHAEVEQKFADWTAVLSMVDLAQVRKSIEILYDRALACEMKNPSSNVFETFVHLFDKYFYDPNSPVRNEEFYLYFISRYSEYDGLSEEEKEKYDIQKRLCSLNRLGTPAADFRFSDKMGRISNLYDIDAPYTLLFFSNPGCDACMNIINVLSGEPAISSMISSGKLAVVNMYIDEDIQDWRSYMPIYPDEWYNCFDPDFVLRQNELYNIRAIPSLYLLDKDKKVLLKDAPENILFERLFTI